MEFPIKIQAITNLTDARYFAAWNANILSFNISAALENPIGADKVSEIANWVAGPQIVGAFHPSDTTDFIEKMVQLAGLNGIEAVGTIDELQNINFEPSHIMVVQQGKLNLNDIQKLYSKYPNAIWSIQFDSTPEYDEIPDFVKYIETPQSISDIIKEIQNENIVGLQLRGGEEEKVGVKSFDELDDLWDQIMDF